MCYAFILYPELLAGNTAKCADSVKDWYKDTSIPENIVIRVEEADVHTSQGRVVPLPPPPSPSQGISVSQPADDTENAKLHAPMMTPKAKLNGMSHNVVIEKL